ncbi:MAG: Inner membrane protein, KefB/KefC family [uncultured Adhaeribacter sp.]|uniref:Inner membrane protein, KefB/KefC family n=1 Tax=uncultured Adhaeribacter sp. TaxID=448109 RepID=A0A6J4J7W1_9BACT|nr:MAG: Inner membrane protein, KefB/KefC family [uncultured Adhaeribacter sp.]
MEVSLLLNIAIIFGVAILIILFCNRLNIPYLIGFLITGIVVSPNSFGLLKEGAEVESFAEVGVILLLFSVGIEFSIKNLLRIKRYVLLGGLAQVFFTIGVTALCVKLFAFTWQEAVFVGFIVSCSSTAIVIKQLQDRIEITTDYGKVILAVLLFQDIIIVPMMLLTPMLSGKDTNILVSIVELILKLMGITLAAYVSARWIIPQFLARVMKLKSQEIFLIATVFIIAVITTLTSTLGLSLALGAFIAGLIIAETDYNRLAITCFLPFRYLFISFFFISMGMLLNYRIVLEYPVTILLLFLSVLLIKFITAALATYILKLPVKTAVLVGLILAQIGEFSFILSKTGLDNGLISETHYQIFIVVAILTMAVTPFLIQQAQPLANILLKLSPVIAHESKA